MVEAAQDLMVDFMLGKTVSPTGDGNTPAR